jgi:hypothetical protein
MAKDGKPLKKKAIGTKKDSTKSSGTGIAKKKVIRTKERPPTLREEKTSTSKAKGRYAATVERGPSAWSKEWSGFMSGIEMKDSGARVKLSAKADLSLDASAAGFSYLFQSPADKKKLREEKLQAAEEKKRAKREQVRLSKMQEAVEEAKKRGINVAESGLNRKRRRELLHLTESEAAAPIAQPTPPKPHELMDPKLAWYQQGPFPLDVVSEKLVSKKAEKKAKLLGLKYNYLLPHPSWIAARRLHRIYEKDFWLGTRTVLSVE